MMSLWKILNHIYSAVSLHNTLTSVFPDQKEVLCKTVVLIMVQIFTKDEWEFSLSFKLSGDDSKTALSAPS